MNRRGQRGMVLVAVAGALAFTSALAWAMVREASMSVAAVDMDYHAQVARYLAEAGLNLARWQNQQRGCNSAVQFGTFDLPGGTITTNAVSDVSGGLSIDVSAAAPDGQSARIGRSSVPVYDSSKRTAKTLKATAQIADQTYLAQDDTTVNGTANFMELTDDTERGLLVMTLTSLGDVLLVSAQLTLNQTSNKSVPGSAQTVYAHRVTTGWNEKNATWFAPWDTPGGDFVDAPVASMDITEKNGIYAVRIDALADAWMKKTLPNYGVLLTTSGVKQAHFGTLEDPRHAPQLVLAYYPRCT